MDWVRRLAVSPAASSSRAPSATCRPLPRPRASDDSHERFITSATTTRMTVVSTTALPRRNTTHTTEAAAYASPAMPTMRFSDSGNNVQAAAIADQNSR